MSPLTQGLNYRSACDKCVHITRVKQSVQPITLIPARERENYSNTSWKCSMLQNLAHHEQLCQVDFDMNM